MIQIGILGAGPNGRGNAEGLVTHGDRCRIAAFADPNLSAAQEAASQFAGASAFTDLMPMLDSVDAVVISSPNWLHPEHAIACAEAGRHVLIEKPMALEVPDAERIVEAVERSGVASMVGFSVRFTPICQAMKQLLNAGRIGRWFSGCARRNCLFPGHLFSGWRGDHARSGGVMSELITHEIDWAVDLLGFPESVFCRKRARSNEPGQHPRSNDHVWISLCYPDERTVTIEGSQIAPISEYLKVVIGDAGSIQTRSWGTELVFQPDGKSEEPVESAPAFNKHTHWLDVIDGRCASVADARHGLAITRLVDAALESAVTGRPVPVPRP